MPARQYPFIDIAVHARVREHFARGDAAILFSRDFARILWANDQGAAFFGAGSIYDFIDAGPDQGDLSLRQLKAAGAQLVRAGDRRQLSIRKFSGFRGTPLTLGANLNHTPGYRTRLDEDRVVVQSEKNVIDAYALWAFSTETKLRLSLSNLLAADAQSTTRVDSGGLAQTTRVSNRSWLNAQLRLEMKL